MTDIFHLIVLGALFVLGLITGGLSNVTSGGAGVFTIFILDKYYSGLTIQQSIGTVLAASTVMVFVGAVMFYWRKEVDGQLSITLGLAGVVGAFLAARFASTIQSILLERAFGIFTVFLAVYASAEFVQSYRRKRAVKFSTLSINGSTVSSIDSEPDGYSRWRGRDAGSLAIQLSLGIAIGFITGLFGVGGGGLTMALLLYLFKLKPKVMLGTSLMASLFRYAGATVGYATTSSIDPLLFSVLAIGGAIGSIVGARVVMSKRTKDSYIQIILILLFVFISYEFLFK